MPHSPGPWEWSRKEDVQHRGQLRAGDDAVVWAEVASDYDDDLPTQIHVDPADAALIAAAPDLLALLRKVTANFRAAIESEGLPEWLERDGVLEAEALLKRIEGKR
jgi:hypothetical protein